ncbi:fungal-specific transcription factor domain-containing protein [Aspergillus karnatakaensis]|uniref:Zn(II)2Cys6 transcription factor n=1 Tax=Aspergillus karnatakaensis TaxID=1810916 RepID=UPI003CCE3F08
MDPQPTEPSPLEQPVGTEDPRPPRRFKVRSSFGQTRQPRSRKNRPCDVCRRRKTACVINGEPPCVFCRSRGLVCQSVTTTHSRRHLPSSTSPRPAPAVAIHNGLLQPTSVNRGNSQAPPPSQGHPENVQSLEDAPDRTAHSMGLASEQDPIFLGLFGSILLSEQDEIDAKYVQVHDGRSDPNNHPVHFLLLQDEFPAHTNEAMQEASDEIEKLVSPHSAALVRLYFRHVHPGLPVLSKNRFLRQYRTDKMKIPASLRGAIYAMACVFWNWDKTLPTVCPFQQYQLVNYAHASLRRELEAPNLLKLAACLLLMHTQPPEIDSVESPSLWILASQATACAQMIGLHQDPEQWRISEWEKRARWKLWWAVFVNDCWSAVAHGNPPHIAAGSFNTRRPTMDDLRCGESVEPELAYLVDDRGETFRIEDGARFLETVQVACEMRAILDCSCQVNSTAQSRSPLHLSYYATQALLFRGLIYPITRPSPSPNSQQWLSTALHQFQSFPALMEDITASSLGAFWPRHSRSQLILCGNFLIYLFLLATEPRDIEDAYRLLESLQSCLERLIACPEVELRGRLLLRPTMLRVNSFFARAGEFIAHARGVRGREIGGSPA